MYDTKADSFSVAKSQGITTENGNSITDSNPNIQLSQNDRSKPFSFSYTAPSNITTFKEYYY